MDTDSRSCRVLDMFNNSFVFHRKGVRRYHYKFIFKFLAKRKRSLVQFHHARKLKSQSE